MKAGVRKRINITKEQYEQVVKNEFASMLQEEYGDAILEEGFWDKLKGGGKKIAKAYLDVFKAYGEMVEDMLGLKPEDPSAPDVPDPQELAQDLASGDTEAAAAGIEDMEDTLQQVKAKAAKEDPEAAKKVDALLQQVTKIDGAIEGEAGEGGGQKTADSPALLDMIDSIIDEWDSIQGKTKDKSLKKAMDYIEKVALAEVRRQRGLKKLNMIREKRKNG